MTKITQLVGGVSRYDGMKHNRWLSAMMVGLPLLLACSGGPGSGTNGGVSAQAAYTKTCAQTLCDSCRDQVASNCSECTHLCSSPFAYSGCYSDCQDLCDSECRACSGPSSCEEWDVELQLPELDQPLFERCLEETKVCRDADYNDSYCNYIARTMRPEMTEEYACLLDRGCEAGAECHAQFYDPNADLGTKFCDRAAACAEACHESKPGFLNSIAGTLRPEIARSLRACIAEETCGEFRACAKAHDALWQLAWEKADPGTPSACEEEWLAECDGGCDCGFTCLEDQPGVAKCAIPCRTDTDCVDTTTGISASPHCYTSLDHRGYCEPS